MLSNITGLSRYLLLNHNIYDCFFVLQHIYHIRTHFRQKGFQTCSILHLTAIPREYEGCQLALYGWKSFAVPISIFTHKQWALERVFSTACWLAGCLPRNTACLVKLLKKLYYQQIMQARLCGEIWRDF